jgi:hypothetical protein
LKNTKMAIDFERILKAVGGFGLFQKVVLLGLAIYPFLHGMQSSLPNFISPMHSHWCYIEPLVNYSYTTQRYITIPDNKNSQDDNDYEECEAFDLPWDNYTHQEFDNWNRSVSSLDGVATYRCNKWMFDTKTTFKSTATSEVMLKYYTGCYPLFAKSLNNVQNISNELGWVSNNCDLVNILIEGWG